MLGSRKQPRLTEGRRIIWSTDEIQPLNTFMLRLIAFAEKYDGDKSKLMIGYWDYGEEIVITEESA